MKVRPCITNCVSVPPIFFSFISLRKANMHGQAKKKAYSQKLMLDDQTLLHFVHVHNFRLFVCIGLNVYFTRKSS